MSNVGTDWHASGYRGGPKFYPKARCVARALKGLACRASGLLAHAEVSTRIILSFQWVQNVGVQWKRNQVA